MFVAPKPAPRGLLLTGENACRSVLHGVTEQPLTRARFAQYFERLYYDCKLDAKGICESLRMAEGGEFDENEDDDELDFDFKTAAQRFKLIPDDDSLPVIVLYRGTDGQNKQIDQWLELLKPGKPERFLLRALQRYIVNLPKNQAMSLLAQNAIEEALPGLFKQTSDLLYDKNLGLLPEGFSPDSACWIVSE